MTPFDRMLIEHSCTQLIYDMTHLVDSSEWDKVGALFTQDARFARPPTPNDIIEGRENIVAAYKSRDASITQHFVSNVRVTAISETEASATCSLMLYIGTKGDPVPTHKLTAPLLGQFADRFRRVDGTWLFSERLGRLTMK